MTALLYKQSLCHGSCFFYGCGSFYNKRDGIGQNLMAKTAEIISATVTSCSMDDKSSAE